MAATPGGIRAGKAFVELSTQDKISSGLKAAEAKLQAFGKSVMAIGAKMAALGAGITAPLLLSSKKFADFGSMLNDMSERTGVSAEALQELGFAAEQTGSSLGDLEISLKKMSRLIVDAADGSIEAQTTLAELGLTFQQLARLTPEDQFKLIGDRLSRITNDTNKTAIALKVFGKSGTQLIPMLSGGAAGLRDFAREARSLGLILSNEDVKAADDFGDKLSIMHKVLDVSIARIGLSLVPILTQAVNWFLRSAKAIGEFITKNEKLIVIALQVGVAITGISIALVHIGAISFGVAAVFGTMATAIGLVGTALAFLISPIGLVIAGLTALGATFLVKTGLGAKALDWLGERFKDLKEDAELAFKGIGDALAAGDIALAGKILWLTLKLEWQKGIAALNKEWLDWSGAFKAVYQDAVTGIAQGFVNIFFDIQRDWTNSMDFLTDKFDEFIGGLMKSWNNFGGFFSGVWERIKSAFGIGGASAFADDAIDKINADVKQKNVDIDASRVRKRAGRDDERKQRVDQLEQDRVLAQQALLDQNAQAKAVQDAQNAVDIAKTGDEVAKARAELLEAVNQAKEGRKVRDLKALEDEKNKGEPQLDPSDIDLTLQEAKKKVDVAGTFSAAALRGMGIGDTVGDDQLKEQKKTNEQIQRLRRDVVNNRGVFVN